jgi:hypothetical protein
LGIHIDEPVAFLDDDQVVFCLAVGIVRPLTPDLRPCGEQFPTATGIFYMTNLCLPVNFNVRDKTIGPGMKDPGYHVGVVHKGHLLVGILTLF